MNRTILPVSNALAGLLPALLCLATARPACAQGGDVLPPDATLFGLSRAEVTLDNAFFVTTGNDLAFYPNLPIQTLYADFSKASFDLDANGRLTVSGGNEFTVQPATPFFLPLLYIDDSPPIIGNFPADASTAAAYVFDPAQNGVHDAAIGVDGKVTSDLMDYVAGPVETPPLPDGGGTHILSLSAFLSPLSPGRHTVSIQGIWDGDAFAATYAPFGITSEQFAFTYHVSVVPEPNAWAMLGALFVLGGVAARRRSRSLHRA